MRVLLLCALILLIGSPTLAGQLVVDAAGAAVSGVDYYGNTVNSDYDTIDEALRNLTADATPDTVFVRNGTYPGATNAVVTGDWPAQNNTHIIGQSKAGVIWQAAAAGDLVVTPTNRSGCSIQRLTFDGSAGGDTIDGTFSSPDFTFTDLTFYNTKYAVLSTGDADNWAFTNCNWTFSSFTLTNSVIRSRSGNQDWTFTNCTFDYSGLTIAATGAQNYHEGSDGIVYDGCTFIGPGAFSSGGGYILRFTGITTDQPEDMVIKNCTFTATENTVSTFRAIYFGNNAQTGDTPNRALVYNNVITLPVNPTLNHYGIEIENGVAGSLFGTNNLFFNNKVYNGTRGILMAEGALGGWIVGNEVRGTSGAAYALQGARQCSVINNKAYGAGVGVLLTNSSTGIAWENSGNKINGNYFNGCALNFEIISTDSDSLTTIGNNFSTGETSWAERNSTTYGTLALFQATQPTGSAGYHGAGSWDLDLNPEAMALLRASGLFDAQLGARGKGLIK